MTALRNTGIKLLANTAIEARQSFVDLVTSNVSYYPSGGLSVSVGDVDMVFAKPTRRAYTQLADRAKIPTKHADRLLAEAGHLWQAEMEHFSPPGPAFYRFIDNGEAKGFEPVLRAVLSDKYQVIDNVDVITTMLTALSNAGLTENAVEVQGDLDPEGGRLCIRCVVPSIGVNALDIVRNYRGPGGRTGVDYPMIFAGIEISNHETGGGAYQVKPRALLQVCTNGMTRDAASSFRRVHLGAKLDEGTIVWSDDTKRKQLEFISSAAEDAIRTFISPEFLAGWVEEAAEAAGVRVKDPAKAVSIVATTASLSDTEANQALLNFIDGGDSSVLGLAHAVTALARDHEDGERQSDLESQFWAIVGNARQYTGA